MSTITENNCTLRLDTGLIDITLELTADPMQDKTAAMAEITEALMAAVKENARYAVEFTIGGEKNSEFGAKLFDASKTIAQRLLCDMESRSDSPEETNRVYQSELKDFILEHYNDHIFSQCWDESSRIIRESVFEFDDCFRTFDQIFDEDELTALRDELANEFERSFLSDKELTDLFAAEGSRQDFLYFPDGNEYGSGVVDDRVLNYTSNICSVSSLIPDECAASLFSLLNIHPSEFANHLKAKGYANEVVENYRSLSGVSLYPMEPHRVRGNTEEALDTLITILDNAYSYVVPTFYCTVDLADFLTRDITRPFTLSIGQIGLQDHLNGSGYLETVDNFTVQPTDFGFFHGKQYRYSVDDVYGFVGSYIGANIDQPKIELVWHSELTSKDQLIERAVTDAGKKIKSEMIFQERGLSPALTKYVTIGDGGKYHARPLDGKLGLLMTAIYKNGNASETMASKFIESNPNDMDELCRLSLVRKQVKDTTVKYSLTHIGGLFAEAHSRTMINENTQQDNFSAPGL